MTAAIVPFPMANRRSMILRQAHYAAMLNPGAAERHIQRQFETSGPGDAPKGHRRALDCA
jgi:hypothetical protein